MTIQEAIYGRLAADTPLAALVGGRIYPNQALQADTFPLVVYQQAQRKQVFSLTGPINLNAFGLHLDCYALSYSEVTAVGAAVRDSLVGFKGALALGSITVRGVFDETADDGLEGPQHADEFGIHRLGMDLTIHFGEEG